MFHKDHVGIQQFGKFFLITRVERVSRAVTFCHQNGGAVETGMGDNHALHETAYRRVARVHELAHAHEVFLLIVRRFEPFDVADAFELFKEMP